MSEHGLTFGQRVADAITTFVGSWPFILIQSAVMCVWVIVNTVYLFHPFRFDGYPFVFLNLFMSAEAAFATPVILMSENRQAVKDRDTAERDLATDQKAERQIEMLLAHLDQQDHLMLDMLERIDTLLEHRAVMEKKET